jgi:hypothetical protein
MMSIGRTRCPYSVLRDKTYLLSWFDYPEIRARFKQDARLAVVGVGDDNAMLLHAPVNGKGGMFIFRGLGFKPESPSSVDVGEGSTSLF